MVGFSVSHSPLAGQLDGEVLDWLTIQGVDCHQGELDSNIPLDFPAKLLKLVFVVGRQDVCKIAYISGGFRKRIYVDGSLRPSCQGNYETKCAKTKK
jgi:hypothetical protein